MIKKDNTIYQLRQSDLFDCHVKVPTTEADELSFKWKGAKITEHIWQQIILFFADHADNEVQVRLYYHAQNKEWAAWAMPQEYPCGMSTKELPKHPDFEKNLKLWSNGWTLFGSVHHHCEASAFQSGTDLRDEEAYTGIHITLGKLDKERWDWHHRIYAGGTKFVGNLTDWFDIPIEYSWVPSNIANDLIIAWLTHKPQWTKPPVGSYPDQWKENLKPKATTWKNAKDDFHDRFDFGSKEYWDREYQIYDNKKATRPCEPDLDVLDRLVNMMSHDTLWDTIIRAAYFDWTTSGMPSATEVVETIIDYFDLKVDEVEFNALLDLVNEQADLGDIDLWPDESDTVEESKTPQADC